MRGMIALPLCRTCGKEVESTARYCDRCGVLLQEVEPTLSDVRVQENQRQLIEEVMRDFLHLEGSLVGVKVLKTLNDLPSGVNEIDVPRRHCEMIQKARLEGSVFYAPLSKQQCKVGATALGMMEPNEELRKNQLEEQFRTKRRFRTEEALWTYVESTPTLPHRGIAVMYGSLGSIPAEPDSVVVVCSPVQAMRLVQAYQHTAGRRATASVGALFSLCADAVASPILTGDLSIALGCGGSRKHAAMKESELALGFPYSIANELADASLTLARYEKLEEHSAGG
jgi:uncharacterized protein (DUF169 family)